MTVCVCDGREKCRCFNSQASVAVLLKMPVGCPADTAMLHDIDDAHRCMPETGSSDTRQPVRDATAREQKRLAETSGAGCLPAAAGGNDKEQYVEIEVPHVQQAHSWDCGLACVEMCIRHYLGAHVTTGEDGADTHPDTLHRHCTELGLSHSIWTIDLAYLLHRYNISHHFCTLTLGANKGYHKEHYYKHVFDKDELRVNLLFRGAAENGVSVEKRSVDMDEILRHLSTGHLLIVLVNSKLLHCARCDTNKCLNCMLSICMPHGYYGHFIVLCGYDLRRKMLLYRNPTCRDKLCCMTFDALEECRHSYGTDDDILFMFGTRS